MGPPLGRIHHGEPGAASIETPQAQAHEEIVAPALGAGPLAEAIMPATATEEAPAPVPLPPDVPPAATSDLEAPKLDDTATDTNGNAMEEVAGHASAL
jgi:hypothetical protein